MNSSLFVLHFSLSTPHRVRRRGADFSQFLVLYALAPAEHADAYVHSREATAAQEEVQLIVIAAVKEFLGRIAVRLLA